LVRTESTEWIARRNIRKNADPIIVNRLPGNPRVASSQEEKGNRKGCPNAAVQDLKVNKDRKDNLANKAEVSRDKARDKVVAKVRARAVVKVDNARVEDKVNDKVAANKVANARVEDSKVSRDDLKVRVLKVVDNKDLLNKVEVGSHGLRNKEEEGSKEEGSRKVRNSRPNREVSQAIVRQDRRRRNQRTKMSLLSIIIVVLIVITRPSLYPGQTPQKPENN